MTKVSIITLRDTINRIIINKGMLPPSTSCILTYIINMNDVDTTIPEGCCVLYKLEIPTAHINFNEYNLKDLFEGVPYFNGTYNICPYDQIIKIIV